MDGVLPLDKVIALSEKQTAVSCLHMAGCVLIVTDLEEGCGWIIQNE